MSLFLGMCDFMLGAVSCEDMPLADRPEICFMGRSNVGKSSFLNALVLQKSLARVSREPGRTREVNFFNLQGVGRLVDLPGYGYAKVPKEVAKKWKGLIFDYLRGRCNLSRVCLLIDMRHGLKQSDHAVMELLDGIGISYQLILTKSDKLNLQEREQALAGVEVQSKKYVALYPEIFVVSSLKGYGISEIRKHLDVVITQYRGGRTHARA